MKKKNTRSTTSKKSKAFFSRFSKNKVIFILFVALFAGAYFINQLAVQPAVYQVKTDTVREKTLSEIVRSKPTNTNTDVPKDKIKPTFGIGKETENDDSNPFEGSELSGVTGTNPTIIEKISKIIEDRYGIDMPGYTQISTMEMESGTGNKENTMLKDIAGGNGPGNRNGVGASVTDNVETGGELSPDKHSITAQNTSGSPDDRQEKNDADKIYTGGELSGDKDPKTTILTGGQLSPDKNPVIKETNTSGSPDDRQENRDAQRSRFGNIGSGYSGTDTNGDRVTVKTETQRLDGGVSVVVTTRTVTTPSGNEIMITKTEKIDAAGGVVDENTTTIRKTKNENGTYLTEYSSTSGPQTTLLSPDKQSDTYFAPPATYKVPEAIKTGADTVGSLSPDKHSPVICPDNTKAVETSGKGWVCAPTSGTNCGVYSFALNGKCYPIGSEVTPGNYVCDWTIGGRPNVNYAFLSTNCPTKSAPVNTEPQNDIACSDGDNAGWWDNNAKKCYRPGEHVALDSTRTVQVCKGGLLSKGPSCPEDVAAGNLSADKNSGVYTAPSPSPVTTNGALSPDKQSKSPVTTNGALSPDKQSNQFNPPESCRFNLSCSTNGSEKCSNDNRFWTPGICVPTNPTYSPDKQSDQFNAPNQKTNSDTLSPDSNGGINPLGKTDEVVSDPEDCMLDGAKKNKVGAYICPGLDGSTDPSLDNTLCQFNPYDVSSYLCLVQGIIYRVLPQDDNNGVQGGLGSNTSPGGLGLQMDASNFQEGDTCINTITGIPGKWQNGQCLPVNR